MTPLPRKIGSNSRREKVRGKAREKVREKQKQKVHHTTMRMATVSKMKKVKETNTAKIMVVKIQRAKPNKNMGMKLLINSQAKRQMVGNMDKKTVTLMNMDNKKKIQAMEMRKAC